MWPAKSHNLPTLPGKLHLGKAIENINKKLKEVGKGKKKQNKTKKDKKVHGKCKDRKKRSKKGGRKKGKDLEEESPHRRNRINKRNRM